MATACSYLTPTTVSVDGIHAIYAAAIDIARSAELPVNQTLQIDQTPPTITCSASPHGLWPANNKLQNIEVPVDVTDDFSDPIGCTIRICTS